jgi:hypothetical protein
MAARRDVRNVSLIRARTMRCARLCNEYARVATGEVSGVAVTTRRASAFQTTVAIGA